MSRNIHSEAEVIAALRQVEAGRKVEDVARELGVSEHTIYGWKAKFGELDVSEAQRPRQLGDENGRLKKLVAEPKLEELDPLGSSRAYFVAQPKGFAALLSHYWFWTKHHYREGGLKAVAKRARRRLGLAFHAAKANDGPGVIC